MNASKMVIGQLANYEQLFEIETKLDRSNATYKPDETVSGYVSLVSKSGSSYRVDVESVLISVTGTVAIQNRQNKLEIDEIIKRTPPIRMLALRDIAVARSRTLSDDARLPFRFKLERGEHRFLESYIGVYLSITYAVHTMVTFPDRRMIQAETPLYVQVPKQGREAIEVFQYPKRKAFMVVSEDIKGDRSKIPSFKIRGELDSEICFFTDDLSGWLSIDSADSPIRSIDLQMLRVERIESDPRALSERTEIQLIQICDGNVTRNIDIPLYMILPRYYSCPSVKYLWCHVNFEVNLQIIFKDGYKVSVNIPIKIVRS